jgi:putative two-component system response regulator
MVTGLDRREDRLRAVEMGVNDFLSKPFDPTELRLRSQWLLRMKDATDALKRHGQEMERRVNERTGALREALEETAAAQRDTHRAHLDTIRRLVLAAEHKDRETAAHIERIGRYCQLIGMRLGLAPGEVEILRHAAPMHDVGKIAVPDAILLKPGKLTEEEWTVMKRHTVIGAEMLHGSPSPLLQAGEVIALAHHERWDGTGYPNGLAGEAIPLYARICAVADVFDALTSSRSYRDSLPHQTAYEMMDAQRGRHFDPALLEVFVTNRSDIEAIQAQMEDGGRT